MIQKMMQGEEKSFNVNHKYKKNPRKFFTKNNEFILNISNQNKKNKTFKKNKTIKNINRQIVHRLILRKDILKSDIISKDKLFLSKTNCVEIDLKKNSNILNI